MFEIPNPLHPAVVHFPIVLTFLSTVVAFFSVVTRRGVLPQWTALLLLLAAASAQFAVYTGGDQDELFKSLPTASQSLVNEHSEWGERTRTVLVIAGVLSLIALAAHRLLRLRRILAVLTFLVALGACWCALEAASRGGNLVFQHQIGTEQVKVSPETAPAPSASPSPQ
jgi:uncharacterized membrane protein